jgi:AhpD family alkylhydroperoxidase
MRDVILSRTSALPTKYKSLIGIAVASQIPCRYCLAADTEFARQLDGATDREINEAIAMAALTRHWSTWLNGARIDEAQWKRDIDKIVRNAQQRMPTARAATPPQPAVAEVAPQPKTAQPPQQAKPPAGSAGAKQ